MKRKLFAILSSLGLMLGLLGLSAGPAAASCASAKVTWYEGSNYTGQSHTFSPDDCTHSKNFDMTMYSTADGHGCERGFPVFPFASLNDCASSWKVLATCHMHFNLYQTTNPSGLMDSGSAPFNRATMPGGWDDSLSYIRFNYTSVCISSPTQ